jgi:CheY-like chemotaxis protein
VRVSEVPKGGIYTAKPGAYVCWRVSDTGSGIPPEYLARIFDPFFTTKEIGKGTGLGLFSVQKIIRSHGGFIEVESTLGTGTDVLVYLPAAADVSPESRAVSTEIPPGRGESILLVDDEEGVRSLCQKVFEKSGYRVLVAAEGKQALEIFRNSHSEINAVMTDIMMPRMDGVTLVEGLRKIRPEMKVIATTGLASDPLVTAAGELGLNALLQKPFTVPTLLRTVRNVLDELVPLPGECNSPALTSP